jgi:hypothetical protein
LRHADQSTESAGDECLQGVLHFRALSIAANGTYLVSNRRIALRKGQFTSDLQS